MKTQFPTFVKMASAIKEAFAPDMLGVTMVGVGFFACVVLFFGAVGYSQVVPAAAPTYAPACAGDTVHTSYAGRESESRDFTTSGTVQQWDNSTDKYVTYACIFRVHDNACKLYVDGHVYTGYSSEMSSEDDWYSCEQMHLLK